MLEMKPDGMRQVPPRSILIPGSLGQQILDHLKTRPYCEVFEMIDALMACSREHICRSKE